MQQKVEHKLKQVKPVGSIWNVGVAEDAENYLDGEGDKRRGVGTWQDNLEHTENDLAWER